MEIVDRLVTASMFSHSITNIICRRFSGRKLQYHHTGDKSQTTKPQLRLIPILPHHRFVFHCSFVPYSLLLSISPAHFENNERVACVFFLCSRPLRVFLCVLSISAVMNRYDLRCLIKQIEKNKHFAPAFRLSAPCVCRRRHRRVQLPYILLCWVSKSTTTTTMTKSAVSRHSPSHAIHRYENYIKCCQLHVILQSHRVYGMNVYTVW